MPSNKFGVIVQFQGKRPNSVMVEGGATVATALRNSGLDAKKYEGRVTLGGRRASLDERLKTNALVSISEAVAGGK
jgi:hypothetical protein